MARFLIDANLPYRFALWRGVDYLHVYDLGDNMPDAAICKTAQSDHR
jgi:predicted nuclease of predicted toxin-antitoxin system